MNEIVRVHAAAWIKTQIHRIKVWECVQACVCVMHVCMCVCNARVCGGNAGVCVLHGYTMYTRIEIETENVRERATKECTCL